MTKLRVRPDLEAAAMASAKAERRSAVAATGRVGLDKSATSEVDALLDKIAQSGIGSLTAKERARLESARAELLKRR